MGSGFYFACRLDDGLVLNLVGYRFHDLGVSFDSQDGDTLLGAIAAAGDDWEDLAFVRKVHSQCESPVGLQSNWLTADRDTGVGVGAAMNDHVRINLKVKPLAISVNA